MTDDREPFREARAAGKAKHQEQRLARAQTVIGEHKSRATVQPYRGYVHLAVVDEAGTSGASILLPPDAAERLANILLQVKAQVEASA